MLFLLLTGFATALTLASVQQFVIAVPISPIPTIPPAKVILSLVETADTLPVAEHESIRVPILLCAEVAALTVSPAIIPARTFSVEVP